MNNGMVVLRLWRGTHFPQDASLILGDGPWPGAEGTCGLAFGDGSGSRAFFLMFQRRADEGCEQRMWFQRLRLEFRMELAAEEPWVVWRLDDFDVILIRRASRDAQARGDHCPFVVAIKLVAMPVPLADLQFPVSLMCE